MKIAFIGMLGILSIEDIIKKQMHLWLLLALLALGVGFHLYRRDMNGKLLLGGIGIGVLLLLFGVASKSRIGTGDGILMAGTGAYLGALDNILLFWLATFFAAITGVIAYVFFRKGKEFRLPFAPFVFGAYVLMQIFGMRSVL